MRLGVEGLFWFNRLLLSLFLLQVSANQKKHSHQNKRQIDHGHDTQTHPNTLIHAVIVGVDEW